MRNLLISTVYKGQHVYGKRSRDEKRAPIVRSVPAIVSEAVWQQAQATLQYNQRFGPAPLPARLPVARAGEVRTVRIDLYRHDGAEPERQAGILLPLQWQA